MLEISTELESIYADAAQQGNTVAPTDAEAEVEYRYVCFGRSSNDSSLYELDDDQKGPVSRGFLPNFDDNVAVDSVMDIVQKRVAQIGSESVAFSLLALGNTT
ncbi:hypothetical protein LTR74_017156 [Friedmanniomyces endolithicus]|nr:hypothetical protein LTR74_017156 [Friedmanniomyces endolithicus]